jgi:hypothetical protein
VERLAAGYEDVFVAVVVERLPGESGIESFQPQARDIDEPQPFVLGCPPERTGSTSSPRGIGNCSRPRAETCASVLSPEEVEPLPMKSTAGLALCS